MKKIIYYLSVGVLLFFGLLTLFLSSSVIFDLFGIREKEGNFVWFIVYANFLCSLLYLLASYGFVKRKFWTFTLLLISMIVLVIAFVALLIHIKNGGIYKLETVYGMIFRIVVTLLLAISSYFLVIKNQSIKSIL